MFFLIESIVACAVFTLFVFLMSRNPIKSIFNYPPAIIERCDELGLVDASNRPGGAAFYVKKVTAMIISGVLLGLLVRYVNGSTTFWCGALTAYALWMVVNWFDAFVLDCLWFCHDKHFVISGTEDMTDQKPQQDAEYDHRRPLFDIKRHAARFIACIHKSQLITTSNDGGRIIENDFDRIPGHQEHEQREYGAGDDGFYQEYHGQYRLILASKRPAFPEQ